MILIINLGRVKGVSLSYLYGSPICINVFSIEQGGVNSGGGLDWDFYIDFGGDLHAFQSGYYSSTIDLSDYSDLLEFDYEETSDRATYRPHPSE